MQAKLDLVRSLHARSLHDSAQLILDSLYTGLLDGRATQSPFGLEVRLELAYAWERKEQRPRAARELHRLIDLSRDQQLPAIQAGALLLMALIHEEESRPDDCLRYLSLAREVIAKHRLRSLDAKLAIRWASYERLFGSAEQAEYYARLSLKHALDQNQPCARAEAHLVLSILYGNSDSERSERHLQKAAVIYRSHNAYVHNTVLALNLSTLRYRQGDLASALRYSDTAFQYLEQPAFSTGLLMGYRPLALEKRSELYYATGQLDSAYHYLDLARQSEIDHLNTHVAEEISSIEASYQDEHREQMLQEQTQLLEYRRKLEVWMLWCILLAVVLLVVVGFSYLRLRRAHESISDQRDVISEKNLALAGALKEQQLLRGELHHRVKNNLQIIIGLLDLQISELTEPEVQRVLESTVGRVYSIAAIHDILHHEDRVGTINFRRYVEKLTDHFCELTHNGRDCEFDLKIPSVDFTLETAVPLGTILNELLTNSFKYAALPDRTLAVEIELREKRGEFLLRYCDNGPGFPAGNPSENRHGLGNHLIRGMARQLRGRLRTSNDGGACSEIRFRKRASTDSALPDFTLAGETVAS